MKKTNDIDHLFQTKLQNHTVTPPPAVWGKLEKELAKKATKKRLGGIYWQAAAGLAVAVGLSVLVWQQKNTVQTTTDIATVKPNTKVIAPKNSTNYSTTNNVNSTTIEKANVVQNTVGIKPEIVSQTQATKVYKTPNTVKNSTVTTEKQPTIVLQENIEKQVVLQTTNNTEEKVVEQGIAKTNETPVEQTTAVTTNPQTTENVEIIVKVFTPTANNEGVLPIENPDDVAPKRKGLGRIWHKLREGELLTLQDVGIDTNKLPRFLKREQ
jgi:thiol:disulfide interchange protein